MSRLLHILFFMLALSFTSAQAESPYKGGMHYTTISKAKKTPREAPAIRAKGKLRKKVFNTPQHNKPPEEDTGPAAKVWKRYKALAAGQAEEEPAPAMPAEAKSEAAPIEAKKPKTGFAAILEKYQANKAQQSQMHTIQVERPKAPVKPVAKTP